MRGAAVRPPIKQRPKGKVILCIDDDESVLECETSFLENFGYMVLTAPKRRRSADTGLQELD